MTVKDHPRPVATYARPTHAGGRAPTGACRLRGLLTTAVLLSSCAASGISADRTQAPTPPTNAPSLSARPTASVGAVDAGVVFFFSSSKTGWLRYDSGTRTIGDIGYASVAVQAETPEFVYLAGPQGSSSTLRWDGALERDYDCGGGGFISFNAVGACATFGSHTGPGPVPLTTYPTPPVTVRLPGEARPRTILPASWGAVAARWSPDSARLAVARVEPPYPLAADQYYQMSLWIVESDGSARVLYRPAPGRGLPLQWSADGRFLAGWDRTAAGAEPRLLLLDVGSGQIADLGSSPQQQEWVQWASDGRLAFVRGTDDVTWRNKQIVVRERDGNENVVTPPDRVSFAPVWDPSRGRLAWITGPSGDGTGYIEGTGVGDRRAVVSDLIGNTTEIRCPGRVVEGVRWSRDGQTLLLLCRRPAATTDAFELWLYQLDSGGGATPIPIVTSLGWDDRLDRERGFAPSLLTSVAWSRAVR